MRLCVQIRVGRKRRKVVVVSIVFLASLLTPFLIQKNQKERSLGGVLSTAGVSAAGRNPKRACAEQPRGRKRNTEWFQRNIE